MGTSTEHTADTGREDGPENRPTAREDWEQRLSTRSDLRETAPIPDLPPPGGLTLVPGTGHVTLRW